MFRVSEMIGKAVVATSSGDKLGTVSDALLDASAVRVVGVVVRQGLLAREHVLPIADVQTVGRDAVLARTAEHLMEPREWRRADVSATRSSDIRGRRVVTDGGAQVGEVSDLLIEEDSGAFGGIEVESRSLGGLRSRRRVIPCTVAPRIGPDAIVISEEALAASADGGGGEGEAPPERETAERREELEPRNLEAHNDEDLRR